MAKTKTKKPLTLPDAEQCQAMLKEQPSAKNMMIIGWSARWERCTRKPTVIATEAKPGPDGQVGAMSLCSKCWAALQKEMPGVCTFKMIKTK